MSAEYIHKIRLFPAPDEIPIHDLTSTGLYNDLLKGHLQSCGLTRQQIVAVVTALGKAAFYSNKDYHAEAEKRTVGWLRYHASLETNSTYKYMSRRLEILDKLLCINEE